MNEVEPRPTEDKDPVRLIERVIRSYTKPFDASIAEHGLSIGMREILRQKGSKIATKFEEGAREWVEKEPTILVATHTLVTEVMALLAALSGDEDEFRSDIKILAAESVRQVGQNFSRYVEPVYNAEQPNATSLAARVMRGSGMKPNFIPRYAAGRLNVQALGNMAKFVQNGGMGIYFPDGTGPRDGTWHPGIGKLIHKLNTEGTDARLVMADIQGSSWKDLLATLTPGNILHPFQHTSVRFSSPIDIQNFTKNAATTTHDLEAQYRAWVDSS